MREASEINSTSSSYAIVAKLATGGMADIFLARTESGAGVERYVVLKRVLRHRANDIKFVHMFLDEARLASQLQHPNIAQVYDTGKLGDSYFFTMEYVHGETVRELLHRSYATGQQIPLACALTIVAGAAAGLQHAHERVGVDGKPLNIVHRDVSPSNLMISYEGNVKLVDFGVAKASLQSIETQSGTVKGKIGYMAPEQCRGGQVDPRCDLFSLGIVMWELLVGERLFKRNTEFESMEAIVVEAVAPPSSKRPEIPKSIDDIVLKLLAKRPADRFQTADELHDAIETAAAKVGIALSLPALKRFVRELFGMRPEPWVELRLREAAPEVVTVTGALLNKQDTAELQLERVFDLSSSSIAISVESSAPRTPSQFPDATPPFPTHRAPTSPTVSATATPIAPGTSRPTTNPSGEIVAPIATGSTSGPLPFAATPSAQFAAVPTPPSGSFSLPSSDFAPQLALIEPDTNTRPRWRPMAIGIGVIAIGVVIGAIVFGVTSSKTDPKPDPVATTAPGAPKIATETPPSSDGSATKGTGKPTDDLETRYQEHKFADVVSRCTNDSELAISHAVTCALAACQIHDGEHARQWAGKTKDSDREAVVSACASSGTQLAKVEPKKPPARPFTSTTKAPPTTKPPVTTTVTKPPITTTTTVTKPPITTPKDPPKPKCDPSDPMACRR